MTAPAVEAATVAPQRRRIVVGKKIGRGPFVVEMSEADKAAHAAASYVSPRGRQGRAA
ncbi:hypothetical protein GCM10010275_30280 [Streptomyces litmocidini]|uniref:hypothetical protein n=1 Tax=Streptomyces litmocidini TaxID=67318 RepID=UPI00167EC83E|nr:hypothetical protein [Streptomyces litmocidini]GGU91138.1 hypothetical protein GCM10010275_30280 [Streptomyces litmocidini]